MPNFAARSKMSVVRKQGPKIRKPVFFKKATKILNLTRFRGYQILIAGCESFPEDRKWVSFFKKTKAKNLEALL